VHKRCNSKISIRRLARVSHGERKIWLRRPFRATTRSRGCESRVSSRTHRDGHAGMYLEQQLPLLALLVEYLQLMVALERAQPAELGETEILVHCHCRLARCGMQGEHAHTHTRAAGPDHREIRLCRTNLPRAGDHGTAEREDATLEQSGYRESPRGDPRLKEKLPKIECGRGSRAWSIPLLFVATVGHTPCST